MTRRTRPALAAAAALAALLALSGCSAAPAPAATSPAASPGPACPSVDEVAGLTALPFTARTTSGAAVCRYSTDTAAVTIARRPVADRGTTLSGVRFREIERGRATEDAPALSFDAFTTRTGATCTAWLLAGGAVTTVSASRSGAAPAQVCALARAAGVLAQGAPARTASVGAPIVDVVAPARLLGAPARTVRLAARLGAVARARVELVPVTGAGIAGGDGEAAAAHVQPAAAAVVLVAGEGDVGRDRLAVVKAATAAFAAAATTAPHARRVLVGPLLRQGESMPEVLALRNALAAAARISGATFVDPIAGGWGVVGTPIDGPQSDRVAARLTDRVAAALR